MTPHIALLLLDVDGVLLHYQRARRVLWLAQALRRSPEQVQQALFGSGAEAAYDRGALQTSEYLRRVGDALQCTLTASLWVEARLAACQVQESVVQRLLALPPDLPLAVLTNNGALMAEVVQRLLAPLRDRLGDRVLCSGMLGGRKPDPAVFLQALQVLQVPPQHTLFVDDLFGNVRGARTAGLHAETVRDGRSLGKALRRYGLR